MRADSRGTVHVFWQGGDSQKQQSTIFLTRSFGGGFFGDYTDISASSNGNFHALWTDSNNVRKVVWWYGYPFVPTMIHQQDVVTASGNF